MVRRIGRLVLGKKTGVYFLLLLTVMTLGMYAVPLIAYIYLDIGLVLALVVVIAGLTASLVFSFKTNPTTYNKFLKWINTIVLSVSLVLVFLHRYGNRNDNELEKHGVQTQAIIVNKYINSGHRGIGRTYKIQVGFEDENDIQEFQSFTSIMTVYNQVQINDEVSIEYSRRYPKLVRLVSGKNKQR
ncbi:MAG: hypothetical protein ACI9JN_001158 [Bacteroidia bacterium]|jgi:hypothetical protein